MAAFLSSAQLVFRSWNAGTTSSSACSCVDPWRSNRRYCPNSSYLNLGAFPSDPRPSVPWFIAGPGAGRASVLLAPKGSSSKRTFTVWVWQSADGPPSWLSFGSFLPRSSLVACSLQRRRPPLVTLDSLSQPSMTHVFLEAWFSYMALWWLQAWK